MALLTLPDGTATEVDWRRDAALIARAQNAGGVLFGTLAGAVVHGGVAASAFDQPLKATPLYDGVTAMAQGSVVGLSPVAVMAEYRICAFDGQLLHPARSPEDLPLCEKKYCEN